jgi:hypothetical protein
MKNTYEFTAIIHPHPSLDAAYIEFPYDVETEFGVRGQVKVLATFDGVEYRGSLAKMGGLCHCLGLTKEVRRAIGKSAGDTVRVVIRPDTAPRTVDVPDDLKALFSRHAEAREIFDGLSFTHKKEYVQWITSAKKRETRQLRVEKTIEMLLAKVRHP